jgi:hypothetical protein
MTMSMPPLSGNITNTGPNVSIIAFVAHSKGPESDSMVILLSSAVSKEGYVHLSMVSPGGPIVVHLCFSQREQISEDPVLQ